MSEPVPSLLPEQQNGVLVLNKPKGLTSARCIALIKRRLGQKKIGHGGTLDPMATGVLLVLLGQATKLSGPLMEQGEKIYSGEICLGLVTDTWDAEGAVLEKHPVPPLEQADVQELMGAFVGSHEQQVPPYSAAKHEGRALYKLARKGIDAPVKKKIVNISRCEAELVGLGRIRFRVACGSGTYIRSLAHSLGKRLGCGGMLSELTREYSHPFGIEQAHPLDELLDNPEGFASKTVAIAHALPAWPAVVLTDDEAALVRNGARLPLTPLALKSAKAGTRALLLDKTGAALALAEALPAEQDAKQLVWRIMRGLWNI
ncbi:tRNA pseudouridine(55) synthase TruB [Desulfovibrio sp. OttesenSCG-928-M14]|nr:tRNA pseudouridine(55) synthase TruB [Desulfovibrio sp. OttesenSCG-928-M14]